MIVLKPTICRKENGQISFTLPQETSSLPPLAATIGVFDGVHLGHHSLLLTLDENPKTFANYAKCCDPANNLHPVVHISSLSGRYELKKNHMQMTKYSNDSYDVRILLDEIIYDLNK